MKKYDSILKRVEQMEYKLGISYAKTSGKLFSVVKTVNLIGVIYLFLINSLFTVSVLMNSANGNKIIDRNSLILIVASTVLEIISAVFIFTKLKIIGSALGIAGLPYLIYIFLKLCEDISGTFGRSKNFYIRHLPSYLIIAVCCFVMLFIALRERIKTNREYKRIITNIYNNFKNEHKTDDFTVSDDDWNEFLENYGKQI